MNSLIKFPKKAFYGRVIPKNKIYEKASPSGRVKQLFVEQVERIRWSYKLSPATINLPSSIDVDEIQVFTLDLRDERVNHDILRTIDKAIPSSVIFILNYNGKLRYVASYKRTSEADKSKRVISGYFETEWINQDAEQSEMPMALNMDALYRALIKVIMPVSPRAQENMTALIERMDRLRLCRREASRLKSRINKEKQFNRRVELNRRLKEISAEIQGLKN